MKKKKTKTQLFMGTVVSITVVTELPDSEIDSKIVNAFEAFRVVERICSRFNSESELVKLSRTIHTPMKVSDLLFEAIRFAWQIADFSNGAFDPTLGRALEEIGFNQNYLTGQKIKSNIDLLPISYKDVVINDENRTILLNSPLLLDLGAVAKGLAIDMASKELKDFDGFMVDAGGDIFVGGLNEKNDLWHIGIRNPLKKEEIIRSVHLTNSAICTSGNYERISTTHNAHHLINPQTGTSSSNSISCTVIAPFAMMADALSTSAFILGEKAGIDLLEETESNGLIITSSLDIYETKGMEGFIV